MVTSSRFTRMMRRASTRVTLGLSAILFGTLAGLVPSTGYYALAGIGMKAPEVTSSTWINSHPLSQAELRGKVVLVEFWTFGCFNCRNVEPQVKDWYQRYSDQGLVVIGVHSPEFAFEKDLRAVQRYVTEHGIRYPVALDNDFVNWNRFGNRFWPAIYLLDKRGVIRYQRVGEGGYPQTEAMIQRLLVEPS